MSGCDTHNLFSQEIQTHDFDFFLNDEFDEKKNSIIFRSNRTSRLVNMKALQILKIAANPITRLQILLKRNVDISSSETFLSLLQMSIYMLFLSLFSIEYSFRLTDQSL